ncbi:MAG: phosphopyruvate hydratase [Alphaproteobacteria bacterium]|nr:MAG: phosphopyruvate hydratase [Alphaproteobacteria bacterium]
MSIITKIYARQILDSRGNPTVEAEVVLDSGHMGRASAPSGASTGRYEAVEKRDRDAAVYAGKSVFEAVDAINVTLSDALVGRNALNQHDIDRMIIEADGTENKANLGANATLAVSLALAKAAANYTDQPLFRYIGGAAATTLPIPMMNLLNGGAHANNSIDIQEFMIVPHKADSFSQSLEMGARIFYALKSRLNKEGLPTSVGDEGGFAPNLTNNTHALDFLMRAITEAGFTPGIDVSLALDVAANELYQDGQYHFYGEEKSFTAEKLVYYYENLVKNYPIVSLEDPFAEDDWEGWAHLTSTLGEKIQIVGDDLYVTNTTRLQEGIQRAASNAILIKPNQIGTLSETLAAVQLAHKNAFETIISHRSGETEDTIIADLAVATNAGQIKAGSLSRSDRISKYNQLLRIEEELGVGAQFPSVF